MDTGCLCIDIGYNETKTRSSPIPNLDPNQKLIPTNLPTHPFPNQVRHP